MKLVIKEEMWKIISRTGKQKIRKTDKQKAHCYVGKVITFEKGKRIFEITEVTDKTVGFTVLYADERYNKQWKLKIGESTFYTPVCRDGGYRYFFKLK